MAPNFWEKLGEFGNATALIDEHGGRNWTYRELEENVCRGRDRLRRSGKKLIFLLANNDADAIACYLSALAAGHPVYLGKGRAAWPDMGELLQSYAPDILLWKGEERFLPHPYRYCGAFFDYHMAERGEQPLQAGDTALLLSTSGSLGNPKVVRLSWRNISVAASQVAKALRLSSSQRAVTSLPLHFVYGLSVVHGHLEAGASLVMTQRSVQDRAFWQLIDEAKVTNLAGVPWTYDMMRALSFDPVNHLSIRHLSLSGGALAPDGTDWLVGLSRAGVSIYSMYGQTEAGGRISVLPPEMFERKAGSVGYVVEGGSLRCDAEGNIHFQGPNVMLGYARSREDLAGADQQCSLLRTGDQGFMDNDGCLHITGRTSRMAKLFGLRIELDEVEAFLGGSGTVAAACSGKTLDLFVERRGFAEFEGRLEELLRRMRLPNHCVRTQVLADLPRAENGKIQYGALPYGT